MRIARIRPAIIQSDLKYSFESRTDIRDPSLKGADARLLQGKLQEIFEEHAWGEKTWRGRWPKLQPATLKQRQREGFPYPTFPMLYKRGDVFESYRFTLMKPERITFGSENEIATYLEMGTKKMKARSRLWLKKDELDELGNMLADNLAGTLV